jgi:hypothetical protein
MLPMAVQTHPTELSMLKVTNFQGGEHRVVLEREREREREREKSMRNVTISANEKWMNHLDRPL